MITFTKAYKAAGGIYDTLKEAQIAEIGSILGEIATAADLDAVSIAIVENADKVVGVLTTTKDSRPRARKENGGTKRSRKPKVIDASETAA